MDRKPRPLVDLTAQCACGSVSVRFVGKVLSMFMCSCEDCQRATGAGHSAIVLARPGDVTIAGGTRSFARPANSGATLTRHFCPQCGTPLYAQSSRAEGVLMLSVGLFDKELYNYIQSDQVSIQMTNNGVSETVVGNMPQNHGHGQIRGVEAQSTYFYDFLPGWLSGFGTDVNFTILETHGTQNTSASVYDSSQISSSKLKLPLEQLSRYSYNATLMYAKYGIDARLAYNWRSRYLMSASASNVVAPAYMEDYGQLDGSVMYALNKNFKIGIQAVNLTGARNIIDIDERDNWYYGTEGNTSPSLIYRHNWTVADKRISLVLRGAF